MATRSVSRRKTKSSRGELPEEKIYRDFLKQPPQISDVQMEEMEEAISSITSQNAVARRMGLASLSRSGAQLVEGIQERESAQAVASAILSIDQYVVSLKALVSMMESASTRLSLALCSREDMQDLLKLAQAEHAAPKVPRGMLS